MGHLAAHADDIDVLVMILMLTHDLVELLAMLELAGKTRRGKRTRELHTRRADDVLGHHEENETLPKAQRTRGLRSSFQSNLLGYSQVQTQI